MSPELERLAGNRIGRRVVIETIADARQPFSARYLYEMVKERNPTVSRTTVYRTLRLLRERGPGHIQPKTSVKGLRRRYKELGENELYVSELCLARTRFPKRSP